MTSGNDILFPGCSQLLTLDDDTAQRLLREVSENEPPEFAYMTVSAWGDPGPVGTVAIIDDIQYYPAQKTADLLCTGVTRFNAIHHDGDLTKVRVETFHDDVPTDEDLKEIISLEERVVAAMTDIVTLSIKISDDKDETRQRALNETLRRVEAFCGKKDGRELLQHWILELSPTLRRELLSFIVIDLLSISFMDRRSLMQSTSTENRLSEALRGLDPFIRELAAKGAIVGALGKENPESDPDSPPPSLQ